MKLATMIVFVVGVRTIHDHQQNSDCRLSIVSQRNRKRKCRDSAGGVMGLRKAPEDSEVHAEYELPSTSRIVIRVGADEHHSAG